MVNIVFSEKFVAQFESLPLKIQNVAHKKIEIFAANPKHSSLKTHKLKGPLQGYFSFSVDYDVRIVFQYKEKGTTHFLKIGSHEVYR